MLTGDAKPWEATVNGLRTGTPEPRPPELPPPPAPCPVQNGEWTEGGGEEGRPGAQGQAAWDRRGGGCLVLDEQEAVCPQSPSNLPVPTLCASSRSLNTAVESLKSAS